MEIYTRSPMTEDGIIRKPDWTISPDRIQTEADTTIADLRKTLEGISKIPPGQEELSTLQAFEEVFSMLDEKLGPLTFLKYVSSDKAQRDAADDVEKKLQKFQNEVMNRKDIYDVIVRLEPNINDYGMEEQTLLRRTLEQFRHRGAALDDDKRREFLEISNNITVLESDYNRILNEETTTLLLMKEELDGVPNEIFEDLDNEGGAYEVPLDYPFYIPVRNYAKRPETRKRMTIAFHNRGGKQNSERLADALALRDRKAKLAGFSSFAEYNISIKMAKTPKRVFDFMNDLKGKLTLLADREIGILKALKAKESGTSINDVHLDLWDLFYYHEILMKEKYAVDQNEIKKYFPMDRVISGALEVYQRVLDLDFIESENPNAWHDDVREFKVIDRLNGEIKGTFYLDLYPREGKYKHYAVFDILNRRKLNGDVFLPVAAMVANFQKPTKSQPSLLTHPEVETFFHEFGHLMHVVSNSASYSYFGLDGVLPDFIETPSMMFQNWVWKEEVLSLLSGHFEDPQKKLPSDLLKKLIDGKLLNIGLFQLRQVFFSLIDMLYHTEPPENPTMEWFRNFREIALMEFPEDSHPDASFGHLMGGYEAGYYGYLWSKVYAEDMFTKFEENGFMDKKTGSEYRLKILAPGGSRDPDELVRDFLGREANSDAFMKSLGIGKST